MYVQFVPSQVMRTGTFPAKVTVTSDGRIPERESVNSMCATMVDPTEFVRSNRVVSCIPWWYVVGSEPCRTADPAGCVMNVPFGMFEWPVIVAIATALKMSGTRIALATLDHFLLRSLAIGP